MKWNSFFVSEFSLGWAWLYVFAKLGTQSWRERIFNRCIIEIVLKSGVFYTLPEKRLNFGFVTQKMLLEVKKRNIPKQVKIFNDDVE